MRPDTERRRYPRIAILGRVHGAVRPLDVPITLLNVSLGGFLMQTPHQYQVGETHEFQLTMKDQEPFVVRARVAHAMRATVEHQALFLFGMEFVHTDQQAIEALLASLS